MENKRNYYRLLHVQFDAPAPVIKGSYRTMMQKMRLHPDLGGDEGNAQLLNEALATLLDPAKRKAYDQWLHKRSTGPTLERAGNRRATASASSKQKNKHVDVTLALCSFCQTENHIPPFNKNKWGVSACACRRCKAPLNRAETIEPTKLDDESRRVHRSMLQTSCSVYLGVDSAEIIHAKVVDFSVLGLSIHYRGRLPADSVVLITSNKFRCVARVSYSNVAAGVVTSGLEFLTLDLQLSRGDLFTGTY